MKTLVLRTLAIKILDVLTLLSPVKMITLVQQRNVSLSQVVSILKLTAAI